VGVGFVGFFLFGKNSLRKCKDYSPISIEWLDWPKKEGDGAHIHPKGL
jgi:hypothetical protein